MTREDSVTGRYSDMDNSDFQSEIQQTWTVLNEVQQVLSQAVSNGTIRPIDAIRGFSALTANVLGYEEFVPRQPSVPVFGPNS